MHFGVYFIIRRIMMENTMMTMISNTGNTSFQTPSGNTLTASEYSNLVKPTANYFGAGLDSLTSYLDD
jgi:hypothetical protein